MDQKTQRFATIRKIIRNELISSQEELIARLRECGVEITQSTLSRDLKYMNVAKVPHKEKGYIYVLPNTVQHDANVSSNISDNITSLTFSGNLGVLKTKSGYASALAAEDYGGTARQVGVIVFLTAHICGVYPKTALLKLVNSRGYVSHLCYSDMLGSACGCLGNRSR